MFRYSIVTANLKHGSTVVSHGLPSLGPRLTELCPFGLYCSSGRRREKDFKSYTGFQNYCVELKHMILPAVDWLK